STRTAIDLWVVIRREADEPRVRLLIGSQLGGAGLAGDDHALERRAEGEEAADLTVDGEAHRRRDLVRDAGRDDLPDRGWIDVRRPGLARGLQDEVRLHQRPVVGDRGC